MTKTKVLNSPFQRRRRNLIYSVLAILIATAATWLVIEQANPTEQYLVAKQGISAGSLLSANSVEFASVNLAGSAPNYLKEMPPKATFLITSVRPGELIALAQLTTSLEDTRVPVQINPDLNLSTSIRAGSAIDLWASSSEGAQVYGEPRILSLGAEVSEIIEPSGMFADANKSVEIMVHPNDLQPILFAIASGDKFAAVLKPTLIDQ